MRQRALRASAEEEWGSRQGRELYKYGPRPFLELLRAAIHAYLQGKRPTVRLQPRMDGRHCHLHCQTAVGSKNLRVPPSREYLREICDLEDHGLLEDAQEGFRKNRSTQRQLCKLQCLLAAQRRAKRLSVMLFLDIKNTFNAIVAMNHGAIFHVMKLCGFPADDIRLFQRLYRRTFLFMGNLFGESAACFLARGVPQGAHPSPLVYVVTFNPIHVIARVCGRGCSMPGLTPSGSSGLADDTTFHTDGVNAVSSMQAIVSPAGAYLT